MIPMKISDLFVYSSFYSLVVHNLVISLIIMVALIFLLLYILYLVISAAVEGGIVRAIKKHSISITNDNEQNNNK